MLFSATVHIASWSRLQFAVCNEGSADFCLVTLNASFCSVPFAGPEVPCFGAAAQGTAGHRRQQAVSFCLVPSYEKGYLQARCLLQGNSPPLPACIAFQCTLAASLNLSMFIYVRLAATGAAVGVNVDAVGVSQDAVGVVWDVAKDSQSGIAFI